MSDYTTYPFLPQGDVSFQNGKVISYLPQPEENLDSVYATVVTSDQLHAQARCIGSIRPECESVRVALHVLLSIALSHRNNLLFPIGGFEHIARAHMVMRTFVPDPRQPEVFAILVQVVIGARNAAVTDHDPNVSSILPVADARVESDVNLLLGGGDTEAKGDEGDGDPFEVSRSFQAPLTSRSFGDHGKKRKKPKVVRQDASTKLLSIVDVSAFLRNRLTSGVRQRYDGFSNVDRLLPPEGVAGTSRASGQRWDLLSLPEELGSAAYLQNVMSLLIAAGYDSIVSNARAMSTEATMQPLTSEQKAMFDDCRDHGLLWFSDAAWSNMTAVRMALSLPVALRTLQRWVESRVSAIERFELAPWWHLSEYTSSDLRRVSSPSNCHVTVEAVQDEEPAGVSLRTFLFRPLPMKTGIHTVLSMAAVQLSILSHRTETDVLRLLTSATSIGLSGERSPWLPGVAKRYAELIEKYGSLSVGENIPEDDVLFFFMSRFSTTRSIPVEIEDLRAQGERESELLLGNDASVVTSRDRAAMQQMRMTDLELLVSSGTDSNLVGWASYAFFRLGSMPLYEPSRLGPQVDIDNELLNMRRVFAGRQFSDLTSPSTMWAKLGMAVRDATGLVRIWPETTLILPFGVASFLDAGERPHLEISGDPSSGKTAAILGAMHCLPPGLARSSVYRSDAAMRDPTSGPIKNVVNFAPEAGDQSTVDTRVRAVMLSSMSERNVRSETVRIDPATGLRSIATCVTRSSSSWVMGTNLPATDPAFVSRMMSLVMQPLGSPVHFFGEIEAISAMLHEAGEIKPAILRALHFFLRCVAAYCMLINAGVVEPPDSSPLNVAVLNHLLPRGMDGSHLRFYKQSLKLCRAMECMWVVFRFLTDPLSPLTVAFRDRLDLTSLAHARAMDMSHAAIPVFWASAMLRLRRHNVRPRVVEVLLATALSPRQSTHPRAVRDFKNELARTRADAISRDENPATLLRAVHLLHLQRMFPRPFATSSTDAEALDQPGGDPAASDTLAFFRWERVARQDDAPDAYAGSDPPGVSGVMRGEQEHETESAALAFAGFFPQQAHGEGAPPPRRQAQLTLDQLSVLRAEESAADLERLVELILTERNGRRGTATAAASRGRVSRGGGTKRGADARDAAVASGHTLLSPQSVATALQSLRIVFYSGGWASVDVNHLDCDDASHMQRQFNSMAADFSIPRGAYVTHGCMVPMGRSGAEAFPTLVVSACGARSLHETLNNHGGWEYAAVRGEVSRQLVASSVAGERAPTMPTETLTVGDQVQACVRAALQSPLAGVVDGRTWLRSARTIRSEADQPALALAELLTASLDDGANTHNPKQQDFAINLEDAALLLSGERIGNWEPGLVFRGDVVSYHEFEACSRLPSPLHDPSRSSSNLGSASPASAAVAPLSPAAGSPDPTASEHSKRRRRVPVLDDDATIMETMDRLYEM